MKGSRAPFLYESGVVLRSCSHVVLSIKGLQIPVFSAAKKDSERRVRP